MGVLNDFNESPLQTFCALVCVKWPQRAGDLGGSIHGLRQRWPLFV